MSVHTYNRRQAIEKEVKDLYLKVSFGASGAPTIVSGYGFVSITRNSAGDYSVVLDQKYYSLKFVEGIFLWSTAQDIRLQLKSEAINASNTFSFFTLTGASATDPSSGNSLLLKVEVKNTSVV